MTKGLKNSVLVYRMYGSHTFYILILSFSDLWSQIPELLVGWYLSRSGIAYVDAPWFYDVPERFFSFFFLIDASTVYF